MKANKEVNCIFYCVTTKKCNNPRCPIGYCFMAKNLYCEYQVLK
jgi:hypothetical protein